MNFSSSSYVERQMYDWTQKCLWENQAAIYIIAWRTYHTVMQLAPCAWKTQMMGCHLQQMALHYWVTQVEAKIHGHLQTGFVKPKVSWECCHLVLAKKKIYPNVNVICIHCKYPRSGLTQATRLFSYAAHKCLIRASKCQNQVFYIHSGQKLLNSASHASQQECLIILWLLCGSLILAVTFMMWRVLFIGVQQP